MGRMLFALVATAALPLGAGAPGHFRTQPSSAAGSVACTAVAPQCTDWVAVGAKGGRSLVYTTYPLTKPNARIARERQISDTQGDLGCARRQGGIRHPV